MELVSSTHFDLEAVRHPLSERHRERAEPVEAVNPSVPQNARLVAVLVGALLAAGLVMVVVARAPRTPAERLIRSLRRRWW